MQCATERVRVYVGAIYIKLTMLYVCFFPPIIDQTRFMCSLTVSSSKYDDPFVSSDVKSEPIGASSL